MTAIVLKPVPGRMHTASRLLVRVSVSSICL